MDEIKLIVYTEINQLNNLNLNSINKIGQEKLWPYIRYFINNSSNSLGYPKVIIIPKFEENTSNNII